MTDSQIWRRLVVSGALLMGLQLAGCSSDGFVDEGSTDPALSDVDGGFAKSMLISMGAIDDPHPVNVVKYQPRPSLVVPPSRNLPAPQDDAKLAKSNFPVDPEVRDEQERQARLTAGSTGQSTLHSASDGRVLTLAEQERYRNLPKPQDYSRPTSDYERTRPLRPDELDGVAQANAVKQAEASGAQSKAKSLLTPPEAYRTPSDKAPLETPPTGLAAMKPSWWPF